MNKSVFTVEEIKRKIEQYCVYQDRCHKEVEQKLKEYKLIPEAREHILLHLLEHNFLNEERFAKSFARGKFRIKKWGKDRIVRELKFRDISTYNIKSALKEIDEEEYIKTLYNLVEKKNVSVSETNHFKRKKKIVDYLLYRGFESSLIYEALKTIDS
ncbi:RecX family transcriptional regulator [Tenacibaculum sp. Mcav3-52]|uniref:Regulatory protein RecX n=1 Tax=Tenacibaculum sp. Pbs-1 TaxID=3238748 RepID=A0AB33KXQ0_9FLAO|nr:MULTISPECIES: regulatory protein RecX [Tenacibaculum]GFD71454.1 recombinase RecX [Tenacibaculum sp. KUL113]GFD95097.1 recombinase RecX [Alteromonas sp. KUL154]GFE02097.1 recombinase RecX [Alteromonas sp. KUL156]MCG7500361.1 RecX family transcriptional regulator [Tenacibaculum sp. Mcav3-52]MCO7184572.1 RecX family transcriptional regulator [Tenacibaculum sp. XPcli2-G]